VKTKLILLLLIYFNILFAQTSSENLCVKNLTTWVNLKRDSIKALNLKEITTYKITDNVKKVESRITYNQDGYVLIDKKYSFTYDSKNNLSKIKFPDDRSKMDFLQDSITIDRTTDTNMVFAALYLYNNIFYKKYRRYISKDGKGIDLPQDTYYDTLNLCNAKIIKYNSKIKTKFDCHITSLILNGTSYNDMALRETYKYDFSHQPPNIEFTQRDTLGKFKRTYFFMATKLDEDSPIFSGYILTFVHTEIIGNEYNEDIEEYYVNPNNDKISKFPIDITQSKKFSDKIEIYNYEGKSAKRKKLASFYTLKTEYTYFK
jgi:hypothetical protein